MTLSNVVQTRFDGKLLAGRHEEDGQACILEAESVRLGLDWTDDPVEVRMFDLRPLNDISVPSEIRTPAMMRLGELYAGSLDWTPKRQLEVVSRIIIGTVREIIAELPGLPDDIRQRCREAATIPTAAAAAAAAEMAAARVAARVAAERAARAAAAPAAGVSIVEAEWKDRALSMVSFLSEQSYSGVDTNTVTSWVASAAAAAARATAAKEKVFIAACRVWEEAAA